MKFKGWMTWQEKEEFLKSSKKNKWHHWFAWFPVRIGKNNYRWMEIVERKGCYMAGTFNTSARWLYRYRAL